MIATTPDNLTRCSLCPAMCVLGTAWKSPDLVRVEYPLAPGSGLCPRGTALGELLDCPARLRWARRREGERLLDMDLPRAISAAAARMAGGAIVLIDGASLSVEEIASAAQVAAAWKGVRVCAAIWPEDEQLLLGMEASGADYLADEDLAGCDGFVLIGDVFAANPRCARPILDARRANPRGPVVAIDSGGAIVLSYAGMAIACPAGQELSALREPRVAGAVSACKKLGVVVAAEAGRGPIWQRLGFEAGQLAAKQGGGVCVQTVGANALAVLRMRKLLGLVSLAEAMTPSAGGVRVALGLDVLGMLGWDGPALVVAAAAVPNATTAQAELVLPVALPCECAGTFLRVGKQVTTSVPLIAPPAGVPSPAELLRALAVAAGVAVPPAANRVPGLDRLTVPEPAEPKFTATGGLVAYRQALQHAEGSLTNRARWQTAVRPMPELRISPADAAQAGVADLDVAEVQTATGRSRVLVRVTPRLAAGTMAISEGFVAARRLAPHVVEADRDALVSAPAAATVRRVQAQEVAPAASAAGRQ